MQYTGIQRGSAMIEFLGRADELDIIRTAFGAFDQRWMIVVSGDGGIGKTRLLQHIGDAQFLAQLDSPAVDDPDTTTTKNPQVRVLDIIDFDLPIYEIGQMIARTIAHQFQPEQFGDYLNALYLYQIDEEGEIEPRRRDEQMLELREAFVECFNKASAATRMILRFDTIEKMHGHKNFSR